MEYIGIRKQKNTKYYSYRLKMKLPDGNFINIEKGSFETAELAAKARQEHIISLTTQVCESSSRLFGEVFDEYIMVACNGKDSLKKKYLSYYNAILKESFADVPLCDICSCVEHLHWQIVNNGITDSRTTKNNSKSPLSNGYISGLRAMLNNFFDYTYKMKYIQSHPMYKLPSKWECNIIKQKAKTNDYIKPLFPYPGNKFKLLPDIISLFPKNIDKLGFIDLFGGSATVAVNSHAKRVLINEGDHFLIGIYRALSTIPPNKAWEQVENIVEKYGLTSTNKSAYEKCKADYNLIPYDERVDEYWYWGLALAYHSFNEGQVEHNKRDEFVTPFGMNRANFARSKQKFFPFATKLYEGDYSFYTCHYKYMTRDGMDRDKIFFYADPPYFASDAVYNKRWKEENEYELYAFLESCHKQGIKWMLSNVTHNNGKENPILIEWLEKIKTEYKNIFHIHYLNRDYKNSSYQRGNKGKTIEIVVTNYR